MQYRLSFGKQGQSRLRIFMCLMPASQKDKPDSLKLHNLEKGTTSSWGWVITCCTCLSFNVLFIFLVAYRPNGLLEEVGEYNGAAIINTLHELSDGYSRASGTITWDENGDRFSATYGIGELQYDK